MRRLTLFLGLFLFLTIVTAGSVWAESLADRVISAEDVVEDDIAITDDLILHEGALVVGDVAIFGGTAEIDGTIDGDLAVFGGDVELGENAVITGDCVAFGGAVALANETMDCTSFGSELDFDFGDSISSIPAVIDNFPLVPPVPDVPTPPELPVPPTRVVIEEHGGFSLFGTIGNALGLALLAFLVAKFAPNHLERVEDAISNKPFATGTVGFLTFFSTIALTVVVAIISAILIFVCIGLLGIPIVLALVFLLIAGIVLGYIAIGRLFGEVVAGWFKMYKLSIPRTAALGTFALALALGLLEALPIIGFTSGLLEFVILCVGLGAAALTKLGTLPYPRYATVVDDDKVDAAINNMPS